MYPRATGDLQCGICDTAVAEGKRREHVATCLQDTGQLEVTIDDRDWLLKYREEETRSRASDDPITLLIWVTAKAGQFRTDDAWGARTFKALQAVCEEALGRQ